MQAVVRQSQGPESPGWSALQNQRHDHGRERQAADDAHAPQHNNVQPARRKQSDEESNDSQLGKPERLDPGDVRGYHPLDGVLLLFQVQHVEVLPVAPVDRHGDQDIGEDGARLATRKSVSARRVSSRQRDTYRGEDDQVVITGQLLVYACADVQSRGNEEKGEGGKGPADPNDHGPLIVHHGDGDPAKQC